MNGLIELAGRPELVRACATARCTPVAASKSPSIGTSYSKSRTCSRAVVLSFYLYYYYLFWLVRVQCTQTSMKGMLVFFNAIAVVQDKNGSVCSTYLKKKPIPN